MNRLIHHIRTTLTPNAYHGVGQKPPYFEGWYFKLVDAAEQTTMAIIPGVFYGDGPSTTHAFVMVLDGRHDTFARHVYPVEQFWASEQRLDVRIGGNSFSTGAITLDTPTVRGRVELDGVHGWPVRWHAPGVMGWYAWVPFMQCYHGIVSFDHTLLGRLTVADKSIDFEGGHGYIEKDWGRQFPQHWIWLQSNHFDTPGTCLTASTAMIPWLNRAFRGFIIGFEHEGRLYPFTTYSGAATESLTVTPDKVAWVVVDGNYRLRMTARRAPGVMLWGPTTAGMVPLVEETLSATVDVRLERRRGGAVIFEQTGRHAGLEVQGDMDILLDLRT